MLKCQRFILKKKSGKHLFKEKFLPLKRFWIQIWNFQGSQFTKDSPERIEASRSVGPRLPFHTQYQYPQNVAQFKIIWTLLWDLKPVHVLFISNFRYIELVLEAESVESEGGRAGMGRLQQIFKASRGFGKYRMGL